MTIHESDVWKFSEKTWMVLFVATSLVLHSSSLVVGAISPRLARFLSGNNGENATTSQGGAGSTSIEITLQGRQDTQPTFTTPNSDDPGTHNHDHLSDRASAQQQPREVQRRSNDLDMTRIVRDPSNSNGDQTEQQHTLNDGESPSTVGTSDHTSTGALVDSVGEQRSRLPPVALNCSDAVTGVWRAHKFRPGSNTWYIFTLSISRTGESLRGRIDGHFWYGEQQHQRPTCEFSRFNHSVRQPSFGHYRHNRIDFGATTFTHVRDHCGLGNFTGYNPDHFSGQIDLERNEFNSLNNDGGQDVNEPYVFRRISCDPQQAPRE